MKHYYSIILLAINLLFANYGFSQGDNCSSALTLTNVTNYCSSNGAYTNVGATASGFAVAGCWGATATEDVWFSFTATGTDVLVSVNGSGYGGTVVRPRVALYSGSCTGTITQLACANGTAGSGFTQLYRGGLVLGQTYLIRISSTGANEGTFGLCVNNYNPPPSASSDCAGAGKLCNKNSISVGTLNGGGTNPNEPDGDAGSCMTGDIFSDAETNSVWYTWTCGTSGTLLFDLKPLDPTNDLDYVLYQLSGTDPCGGRTIIRCNTSSCLNATGSSGLNSSDTDTSEDPSCDPGENAYCQQINMVAGTSYALLINNADGNSGFNITWGGTGTFLGPDPNIVASNTTVCTGDNVTFDGSTSTNYSSLNWTFNSTGSPVTASGTGPHVVNFPTTGNYVAILQANSALGCSSVEYANVTVVNGPTISVSPAAVCPGASTVLTASGASTYTWNTGVNTATISVTPSVATVYTVSAGASGCVSSQTVQVSINTVPSGLSAGSDQTLSCSSPSVTLNGSITTPTNATMNWSGANVCATATAIVSSACTQGVYTLTATDPSNGCSATATVQVFPNAGSPLVTAIPVTNTVTCTNTLVAVSVTTSANPVNYSWSGVGIVGTNTTSLINVNQGGSYSYTVTDTGSGCVTTGTQTVFQDNTPPVITTTVSGVVTCLSNTATISSSPSAMNYTWTAPFGCSVVSFSTQTADVTGAGIYTLNVENPNNGCTSVTTASVTQNTTPPSGLSAGSNQTLTCSSTSVTLTGSVISPTNSTISWLGVNVCGNTNSIVTQACAVGVYTVSAIDPANGCVSSSTVEVFSNSTAPTLSVSASTLTLDCRTTTQSATVTSTPNTDVTYSWSTSPMPSAINGSVASFSNAGTYVCTVTNTISNCPAQINVVVSDASFTPTISLTNTQTLTCVTNSVLVTTTVTPSATYNYTWTGTGMSSQTSSSVHINTSGTYTVKAEDLATGCNSFITFVVNSNTVAPNVSATNTVIPCSSNSINVVATSTDAVTYNWTTTNGSILVNGSGVATVNAAGVYTVTATSNANGCVNTATAIVTQDAISTSFTANPVSGIAPLTVSFTDQSSGINTYSWNFGDNVNNTSSAVNPSHVFNTPGSYVVTLTGTDPSGLCTETSTITIEVYENTTLIIPNVFTPNGDGVNDVFKIVSTGMKDLNCDIYNRWGNKVYTISSVTGTWDGTGHPDGTYFFILKCNGLDGKEYKKEGYINIFK